jgi:hypothetical protein
MAVPTSFMYFTESGDATFLFASDTIKEIGLVPLSTTVRALPSIVDIQILLAQAAFVVEVLENFLDKQSVRKRVIYEVRWKPFQHEDPTAGRN